MYKFPSKTVFVDKIIVYAVKLLQLLRSIMYVHLRKDPNNGPLLKKKYYTKSNNHIVNGIDTIKLYKPQFIFRYKNTFRLDYRFMISQDYYAN